MKLAVIMIAVVVIFASGAIAGFVFRYDLIAFKAYTDKYRYLPGELVNVTAKYTNHGLFSVSLTFRTSAMAILAVYSDNGSFVCGIPGESLKVITHVSLGPGESIAFGAHWNQTVEEQIQAPYPSDYFVMASTLSSEFHAMATTASFTISGDPSA